MTGARRCNDRSDRHAAGALPEDPYWSVSTPAGPPKVARAAASSRARARTGPTALVAALRRRRCSVTPAAASGTLYRRGSLTRSQNRLLAWSLLYSGLGRAFENHVGGFL